MDQSLAVMLRQLCYGKISFIVLIPEAVYGLIIKIKLKLKMAKLDLPWSSLFIVNLFIN